MQRIVLPSVQINSYRGKCMNISVIKSHNYFSFIFSFTGFAFGKANLSLSDKG